MNQSGNNRSYRYSFIAVLLLIILAASTIYLYIENNKKKELIQNYVKYIDEIQLNNSRENYIKCDFSEQSLDSLLFPFQNFFSGIWNQSTDFSHKNLFSRKHGYIINNDEEYKIIIALPGFSKEEIMIKLIANNLRITGQHNNANPNDKFNDKTQNSSFSYNITIPYNVDTENITTNLSNGLLTIKFSKLNNKSNIEGKEITIE